MSFTLAGKPVSKATLPDPRWGAWTADIDLVEAPALEVGSRTTLQLGDLSRVCTLRPGGSFGGQASYSVIGGAGRWSTMVERRAYRDDNGVRLSAVAADLARDAGELGAVLEVPDRSLGTAWVRPAMLARDALEALSGGQWWIAADGVTHLGPRPARAIAPTTITVDPYDPELRRGVVRLADEALAQLVPGAVLTAQGLPAPLTIGSLVVRVDADQIDVELFGERSAAELLGAIIDARTAGTRFHAPQPYTVAEVAGGRVSVKPSDARSIAFPELPFLDAIPGLPGATAVLQAGAGVLVAFPAGDPGSPVVVAYVPGVLPVSMLLDATTEISLGAGAVELAKGGVTDLNFIAVIGKLNACCAALSIPPLGSLNSTKTTIAKGA